MGRVALRYSRRCSRTTLCRYRRRWGRRRYCPPTTRRPSTTAPRRERRGLQPWVEGPAPAALRWPLPTGRRRESRTAEAGSCTSRARSSVRDPASSAGCCREETKTKDSVRRQPLPRSRRLLRERSAISFFHPFRSHVPVRIRAEAAVRADEHPAGFLVAFEGPQEQVRRDIGELAAARMKDGRSVAGIVPGAVDRWYVVDHVERRCRLRHHEVGIAAI